MRAVMFILLFAGLGLLALPARAGDDSLYRAFGEHAGLDTLMSDFVGRLKSDARIGRFFKNANARHLSEQLTSQLCMLAGGPCEYEGAPMQLVHRDMAIGRAEFNALVEVLQETMDARGIPFAAQNRMLALLAPLHRQIVSAPPP